MSCLTQLLGQLSSAHPKNLAGLTLCTCWLVPSSYLSFRFCPQGCSSSLPQNCKPETAPSISVLKFMQLCCTLPIAHLASDSRHCSVCTLSCHLLLLVHCRLLLSSQLTLQDLSRTSWLCSDHDLTCLLFCSESCGLSRVPSSCGHKPPCNPIPRSVPLFCSRQARYLSTAWLLLICSYLRVFVLACSPDILITGSSHRLEDL